MKDFDVVVVGAGVAGLRAAVELTRLGARVCVLESKAVLGGRASSFVDPQTGDRVDNGQHVLLGCYHETFKLLDLLGTRAKVRMQPALDVEFVDQRNRRTRLRCPSLPSPLNLIAGLFDWDALKWEDRVAAARMARPIKVAKSAAVRAATGQKAQLLAASPGETVEQWLVNNGQTARLREMLWEPLALAALNQSASEASAPVFARVLADMFGGEPGDAALGLPTVPLDELFADPARRYVESKGGQVRIGSGATVHVASHGFDHVEVRGETLRAFAAVCAVPWYALPELFAGDVTPLAEILRDAARTEASPIVSVNLWLDRQVMRTPFLGLPGRRMQWVFDKQDMFEHGIASHLTMVSSGARDMVGMTNDELVRLALQELRDALPETRTAKVLRATAVRERRASFSLAPGQPARPSSRTDIHGLVLAGDWIDTGLPATIEGAAISGRMAAEALS
jgi:squalene-associated FAD-dependent desaturase